MLLKTPPLSLPLPLLPLLLLLVRVAPPPPAQGQKHEASDLPEDCELELQFFDAKLAKCRNCSDALRSLFDVHYQDWTKIEGEATDQLVDNGATVVARDQSVQTPQTASGRAADNASGVGGAQGRLPTSAVLLSGRRVGQGLRDPGHAANPGDLPDAVLSRLIAKGSLEDEAEPTSDQSSDESTLVDEFGNSAPASDLRESDATGASDQLSGGDDGNPDSFAGELSPIDSKRPGALDPNDNVALGLSARRTHWFVRRFVQSHAVGQDLPEAIKQCKQYQSSAGCQMWANLCVLSLYSHSTNNNELAPKASLFRERNQKPKLKIRNKPAAKSDGQESSPNEPTRRASNVGWQSCPQFTSSSICNSLRDWHRVEKPKTNLEVSDVFASELDEPLHKFGSSISVRNNQLIQLLAYIYAYDGQLLKVDQFDLNLIEKFCVSSPLNVASQAASDEPRPPKLLRVGQSMHLKCQLNLFDRLQQEEAHLLRSIPRLLNETLFVDLFIGHQQQNGAMIVKPVPVLIKNLMFNNQQLNRRYAHDASRWKLVHRFVYRAAYTFDNSAASAVEDDDSQGRLASDSYLLYARIIQLEMKFKRQERGNLMLNSLLLILDYSEAPLLSNYKQFNRTTSGQSSGSSQLFVVESTITVKQSLLDMQDYNKDFDLCVTIVCILSCVWCLIKCYSIQKFQGHFIKLDIYSLILFILISCDVLANLLALMTFVFVCLIYLSLKLQLFTSLLQVFAPHQDKLEHTFLVNLQLAFVFKLIGLAYKLYVRLNVDIFFIDWERPKMLTSSQLVHNYTSALVNQQQQLPAGNSEISSKQQQAMSNLNQTSSSRAAGAGSGLSAPQASLSVLLDQQQQQTSFWRPYTVINRWVQLQTKRRLNLTLQLLLFVGLVEMLNIEANGLATTNSSDWRFTLNWPFNRGHEPTGQAALLPHLVASTSLTFRLWLLATAYLVLAAGQVLYTKYIHETLIQNCFREFIDLCSVANVSLFAMVYARYGFYIHGRNANGSSDCNLIEMNALLEREEKDLCFKRGLLVDSEHQTFQILLPKIVNEHYKRLLYQRGFGYNNPSGSSGAFFKSSALKQLAKQSGGNPASLGKQSIVSLVARNRAINSFLMNFLDHIYKDIDYSVREPKRFEFLMMMDFDGEGANRDINMSGVSELNSSTFSLRSGANGGQDFSRTMSPVPIINNGAGGSSNNINNNNSTNIPSLSSLSGVPIINNTSSQALGASLEKFSHFHPPAQQNAASFYLDYNRDSFASMLWLGIEADLILVELFSLLILDYLLGQTRLMVSVSLVWFAQKLFETLYLMFARSNLITKSMLDEKFLIRF